MEQEEFAASEVRPQYVRDSDGLLSQRLSIPVANAGIILGIVAGLIALATRLPGLDRFAVSPKAAEIALAAHHLIEGGSVPSDLLGQPATVVLTSLAMFFGDSTTTIARLMMAGLGVATVILIATMRNWLGSSTVTAALLTALSPTLVVASRDLDPAAALVAGVALMLATSSWILGGGRWPAWAGLGISLAMIVLSGPLGPIALLLSGPVALLMILQRVTPINADDRIAFAAAGAGGYVLFSTALLTRPLGIYRAPAQLFRDLWSEHLAEIGTQVHLVTWNLILNEPLLLLLAIIAVIVEWDRQVTRVALIWAVVSFALLSVLGPATTSTFALSVLPLALLAGVGLDHIVRRVSLNRRPGWQLAVYALSFILLAFAFVSLINIMRDASINGTGRSIANFLIIVIIAVVPLSLVIGWLGRRLIGVRMLLVGCAVLVVAGGITLRAAVLSASEWPSNPSEILSQGTMSETLPALTNTLHRLSRDLTADERDARMPVGGVALRISVDQSIAEPFAWYFRDYPNFTTFDPLTESPPEDAQVIIVSDRYAASDVAPNLSSQSFTLSYEPMDIYTHPDWGGLISDAGSVDQWWHFFDFIVNRESLQSPETVDFTMLASSEIAQRLFIPTGPYSLSDRAGTGTAAGQFNQPRGIAVDNQGRIYVVDAGNQRIQRFTPDGLFDMSFGSAGSGDGQFAPFPGSVGGPNGIAFDGDGNMYVADTWNHRIQVFTPDGQFLRAWGGFFDAADDPELSSQEGGKFYGPRGIAIRDGLVYITDTGNERVQVFTTEGEFVRMLGTPGSGAGELMEPVGIAVTDDGTVLVADTNNGRIARFTPDGEALEPWPVGEWEQQEFFEPYLTVGPAGNIFASDSLSGVVVVLGSDGQQLTTLSHEGMNAPYGLAFDASGQLLYVTDGLANAVFTINPSTTE